MSGHPYDRVKALAKANEELFRHATLEKLFQDRGLSDRTIKAVVKSSIDAPERLLFMSEEQLKSIPGVGNASLKEIQAYRAKYLGRMAEARP